MNAGGGKGCAVRDEGALGLRAQARYDNARDRQGPGSSLELIIDHTVFEGLPGDRPAIIETARSATDLQRECVMRNGLSLRTILERHPGVSVRPLPDVLHALHKLSRKVIGDPAGADPLTAGYSVTGSVFAQAPTNATRSLNEHILHAREPNRPESSH